mgnify:FL=1
MNATSMKKLIVQEGGALSVGEAEVPIPGPGEVLIRAAVTLICGSELKGYRDAGSVGSNLGHEGAGTVAALGEGVAASWRGRRVGASAISGCGRCPECEAQRYTWCEDKRFHGAMHAEYFVVPVAVCAPLPAGMTWACGALVSGDGFGAPYHTNTRIVTPETVRTVAVFGLGPIGLGSVLLQRHHGRRVIGMDLSPERCAMALALGAAEVLRPDETDPVRAIRELTDGAGADICIEAVGIPETVEQALAAVKNGGPVLLNGEQGPIAINPSEQLIRRDITVTGCWFYHFREIRPMMELAARGLEIERLVTHTFAGAQAPEAFRRFRLGQTGKVALLWNPAQGSDRPTGLPEDAGDLI